MNKLSPQLILDDEPTTALVVVPVSQPVRSLQDWADYVTKAHRNEVAAILLKGQRLWEAKKALAHGQWEKLFKGHPEAVTSPIPFIVVTAKCYMKICINPTLSNRNLGYDLPPSWRALYECTFLPEEVLTNCLRQGIIGPETSRADVCALRQMLELQPVGKRRHSKQAWKRCADHHDNLEVTAAKIRRWMLEVTQSMTGPLVVSAEGRIESGVFWVPGPFQNMPTPKSAPPIIKHRCECGHEHVDRRAK